MAKRSRKELPGAMRLYPSPYALDRNYPSWNEPQEARGKGEDAETRAIRCAQCGAPIEDRAAIANCWNCGSDNVVGRAL